MLEQGIAYRKTGIVNWDPVDQTVLANEQVIDGRGWRTGALVEKREIPMYYLHITRYADELLEALEDLPGWPERVRVMQANWIGRSEGCEIAFPYAPDTARAAGSDGALRVFTTRADTLFGVDLHGGRGRAPAGARRGAQRRRGSPRSSRSAAAAAPWRPTSPPRRSGACPPGCTCCIRSPASRCEVWVANYVLMAYGEGAVMGVPAHDERDFEFAQHNGLPITTVVRSASGAYDEVRAPWHRRLRGARA